MDESHVHTGPETTASPPASIPTPQVQPTLHFIPQHLSRQGTESTTSSIPISQVPVGSWDTFIHGSCPRCHHWHNKVTLRISRNPGVFNSVRCENCAHKWFGIGGNSTHTSLASQETTNDFNDHNSIVRNLLLQTMRNMSAVGSPTLAIVQEDPPNATSPLSSHSSGHPFSPSHDPSARSGSQMANPTITTPQASQEGNTDISNPPPCPTSLARETHSADPTLPNSNNNSQQASRKPNAIKTLGRFIKNRISRLRDRFKRNKSRKSPNVVKPADSTSARESRPTSVQQNSTDEVQTPDPAASNTRQPEDNPPEETPPATVPSLSGDENQGPHRHIAIEFRGELPGLTHRERTALIRRTLTEQQSCTCNSNTCSCSCIRRPRPSSSVVPDNPLVDTASLYSDSPTQGSGQLINDFSLSGIGARFETTNTPSNTSNQIQVQNRSSIGTNLSGLTAVSWESSGGMTATSGPNRYPRARSLPGDAMHAPGPLRRQSNLRLRTNLQTDPEQEEQRVSNGFMERQSTDEDEYMPQEIDGERTPTQDDLSTTRSEALDRDSMDRGRSSIHRMLNGTNSSTSSETETTSAQGRASIDNEPRMNGERTPTDQHNHI